MADLTSVLESVGSFLGPSEANAFPVGKALQGTWGTFTEAMKKNSVLKQGLKGMKNPSESSAHERLVGAPFRDSTISGVYQGLGTKRYIHLDDGRIFPTDAKSVSEIAQEVGTGIYAKEYEGLSKMAKEKWIRDRLLRAEKATQSGPRLDSSSSYVEGITNVVKKDVLGMTKAPLEDQVKVKVLSTGGYKTMYRKLAEDMEKRGLVEIDPSYTLPGGKK
jgi:hypothetical protein